jgi:deazaflavin-dependent oxidoreductase (nitroreductase family)
MPAPLKHIDPARHRGPVYRAYAAFLGTDVGRWVAVNVAWKVDPHLMRMTGQRIGMGLLLPTALLETRGAKSGAARSNAVIYFHDGPKVTVVASKLGDTKDPAWFHNLKAHPDVVFGGQSFRAEVVTEEAERHRLWTLADRVYAPYARYRRDAGKAGRTIPIVQLVPQD